MAQTVVTKFYSTRKRFKEPVKSVKDLEKQKISEMCLKDSDSVNVSRNAKSSGKKVKGKQVNKVTNYLKCHPESCQDKKSVKDVNVESLTDISQDVRSESPDVSRTPKRNLSTPEELTPSKKKLLVTKESIAAKELSSGKSKVFEATLTPKKVNSNARRNLHLAASTSILSPNTARSPLRSKEKTPVKSPDYDKISKKDLASLVNESRSKILFSGRLDELQKSLEKFSQVSAKAEEFQSNSYKITSVVSSAKKSGNESPSLIQGEPAYKKYSYLVAPDTETLVLPYKYKLLAETFRCMDTVVSMLNNRKEKITFEKVQSGVQKMMSKNFLKNHLGQIMSVFPSAYSLQFEKNDAYIINKNNGAPYQLIITPNLLEVEGNSPEKPSNQRKRNQSSFIHMTPQCLLERKNIFLHNLLDIVKKHHQEFLLMLKFPAVSDKIQRWHPKFPVDSVPDIPVAVLPEEPETKVSTAKDVLNKIKGSVRGRVEKALQSVADEHKAGPKEKKASEAVTKNSPVIKKQNSALKGICSDLLEKIRARESAKLIENMTRSPQEEKRLAMLERIPKIAHILWHYFIAERKAAVSVDAAVDKIIHSFNSLTTPDEVKEHLQLIAETMPGWLSFIKISKGEYITMDKKKDLNAMLEKLK